MTLSQIIKLRTNNGRDVADFLVDVMQDRYEDFQICHRLQAARLLTTYGNEDAPNFIDDTADSSSSTNKRKPRRPNRFDTELARVIRENTDDGRSIARFLVNVMDGEIKSFRPHHRMSAARELLDRGFGKSARAERLVHPVENPPRREPVEGPEASTDDTNVITVTPESRESELRQSTDILDTLIHLQPERFEQTVLNLLEGLGYGPARHLGRTGDGGIDGIIDRDALGLDSIYVQAKRWTKLVGEPEVRTFSGSLDPHGATRGLLITTSGFTDTARRTAETISAGNKHIRLVDGEELAHLVNSLDMGFETVTAHRNRKPDEDHPSQHT